MESCKTFNIIPKEEIDRVFEESETASAEMDYTFLCFEDVYLKVKDYCTAETTVIDFGCSYMAQAYWFTDCKRYIGIDLPFYNNVRFETDNSIVFLMKGQDFIKNVLPFIHFENENVIAICSYVPDDDLQKRVAETFKYHYVQYCNNVISDTLDKIMEKSNVPKLEILRL